MVLGCENEDETPENPNHPSSISLSLSNNVLKWTMNKDDDFFGYSVIGSITTKRSPFQGAPSVWDTLLYETQIRLDTSYTLDSNEFYSTYQIIVANNSELTTFSNFISGWVSLWGNYYFIDDTDSLIINGAGLKGEIPKEISNLINLTILSVVDNPLLTGPIPMEIGNLVNLSHLNLNGNSLTEEIPLSLGLGTDIESMSGMYKLTHLDLSDNQLTDSIPQEMWELAALNDLDLSGNQLTGKIPNNLVYGTQIDNMQYLTHLDLSDNQLTGDIPSEIGNLNYLTKLKLNDNQFDEVRVGYNEVTGEISETICNLNIIWSNSSIFNISNNMICSPYPLCIEEHMGVQDTTNCD